MARKAKITNNPDLEKDLSTGVIINNNKMAFVNRKKIKISNKQKETELQAYKDICDTLLDKITKLEEKVTLLEKK